MDFSKIEREEGEGGKDDGDKEEGEEGEGKGEVERGG
jgi:hypothetical protein